MRNLSLIENIFGKFNIPISVLDRYDEPHRFYHNREHIDTMIDNYQKMNDNSYFDEIILSIVFHDIIYDPKQSNNEVKSANIFKQFSDNQLVYDAIVDTKFHKVRNNNNVSNTLCYLDTLILNSTFKEFIDFENKIFKEYQFLDFLTYKKNRIKVLRDLKVKKDYVDYVDSYQPKIGIYAGSFNPFHIGHLNILKKAEAVFDKVIIAFGQNPDKPNNDFNIPYCLDFHQAIEYHGLLTDVIDRLGYDITLIRGLRNATDLQYEMNMYSYLKELKPDIKIVSFFSDVEFNHISSSGIRNLKQYGKESKYLC